MTNYYKKYDHIQDGKPFIRQGNAIYVIGYEEAKQILGDHKRFVKDIQNTLLPEQRVQRSDSDDLFSLMYDNMLSTDAPDHTRLRALVSKAFTNRNIVAMAPRIQQIADGLIDGFENEAKIDLIERFAFPLPIIVICELLGIPSEDRDKFRVWSHAFLGIADSNQTYIQSLTQFVSYIAQLIQERRHSPHEDLISALVHADEDGKRLTEQELFSMIALLIVAGHETTVSLIGNGMAALLQNREQMLQLQQHPGRIEAAIEEFLRYEGPVEMATTRYAAEDVQIGEALIRRGTAVVVILAAVNRDLSHFENATTLNVERESNRHLGFGYGVHYCIGAPLARLEAKIAFNSLLQRLPAMQLAVPPRQLTYSSGSVVTGIEKLPVHLKEG